MASSKDVVITETVVSDCFRFAISEIIIARSNSVGRRQGDRTPRFPDSIRRDWHGAPHYSTQSYASGNGFPVERVDGKTLQSAIRERVSLDADMMTDELHAYDGLSMGFKSHKTIKHSAKQYVRGNTHTNTVEGVFSLLKRGITGSFHHISKGICTATARSSSSATTSGSGDHHASVLGTDRRSICSSASR
jgi:hypothetical protein